MECSPFVFGALGKSEYSAVSAAKAVRGSAPAAIMAVPPINNSRRVSLAILTLLFSCHLLRRLITFRCPGPLRCYHSPHQSHAASDITSMVERWMQISDTFG